MCFRNGDLPQLEVFRYIDDENEENGELTAIPESTEVHKLMGTYYDDVYCGDMNYVAEINKNGKENGFL